MGNRKQQSYPEKLKQAYQTVMSFPEGMRVLRHILDATGYCERLITLDPATFEVNERASMVNLARREVWLDIKQYLTPEQQAKIEQPEMVAETEDPEDKIIKEFTDERD